MAASAGPLGARGARAGGDPRGPVRARGGHTPAGREAKGGWERSDRPPSAWRGPTVRQTRSQVQGITQSGFSNGISVAVPSAWGAGRSPTPPARAPRASASEGGTGA